MTTVQISLLIGASLSLWVVMCWLDVKYQLRFVDWMNGSCSNPFQRCKAVKQTNIHALSKDDEIAQLKARIQVLEKVVTEPAYELNKKLNAL
ncbi:hypothetical protein [Glaciecola sp. SC05]|uniref:hypothetical protein n=1 Tax=Glaciecola sp. SC05 TaxID=1987355 RepID=UPI003527EBF3